MHRPYRHVRDDIAQQGWELRVLRVTSPMTLKIVCKCQNRRNRIAELQAELSQMMHPDAAAFIVKELTA